MAVSPEILRESMIYLFCSPQTQSPEEGCLSLLGDPRRCKCYKTIKVKYQTTDMQTRIKTYTGWTAQIIQHEVDHCNGILI